MLPTGLQSPAHLFTTLVRNLGLERAALLLPDYDENIFVPWASVGHDSTTVHRLRVLGSDMEALTREGSTGVLWEGDALTQLAPYFSHREASMLERLLIVPLGDTQTTQALLVISEAPMLRDNPEVLRIVLAAVSESAARAIREQRVERVQVMRHAVVFKQDEIGTVSTRIEERSPDKVLGIRIDLSDIVAHVTTANAHLDSFRIWQDVLRTIAALFASTAVVTDAGANRVIILVHEHVEDDVQLLVHHVAATLWEYFPELDGVTTPRYLSVRFPDDVSSVSELAGDLLSAT